jgi:hypothetical protein
VEPCGNNSGDVRLVPVIILSCNSNDNPLTLRSGDTAQLDAPECSSRDKPKYSGSGIPLPTRFSPTKTKPIGQPLL